MRVGLSWVRELVACELDARELAEKLTMAGLEVEAFELPELVPQGVVSARVVSVRPHPNADKLTVCGVDVGVQNNATVVCGAPNVRPGVTVAYARPGTTLAAGRCIEVAELRGVRSEGMLCSEVELGLGGDGSRLMILPPSAPTGRPIAELLGLERWVLEVSVTPNRGDCLSVVGIAREVAALTGARLRAAVARVRETGPRAADQVKVEIMAPGLCGRYAARVVRDVTVQESPFWLRHRLEVAGVRPINNVVDITNFVMLERGQPLHAFDLGKIRGNRIVVRQLGRVEAFCTLDGAERELGAEDLVICDSQGPVALAGIMGGGNSEISSGSKDVLLESAFFDPSGVRRTARRLGISTESSYRFERGVDPQGVVAAVDRAASLLSKVARGKVCRGVVLEEGQKLEPAEISLRSGRVSRLLGVRVATAEIRRSLRAIGAKVKRGTRGALLVVPPSHRFDLTQEVDLIEEVARIKGYEEIPTTLARGEFVSANATQGSRIENRLREILLGQGLTEMVLLPFVSRRENELFPCWLEDHCQQPVSLLNPLTTEEGELRQSLIPALLRVLRYNLNQGESGVHGFSVGRVYRGVAGGECRERRLVAGVLYGKKPVAGLGSQGLSTEFADVKGVLENVIEGLRLREVVWEGDRELDFLHPGKSALVRAAGKPLAVVGALHPKLQQQFDLPLEVWLFELDFQQVVDYAPSRLKFRPLPRYPAVRRDVSLVVREELPAGDVIQAIVALDNPLIVEVGVIDHYRGAPIEEGYKSLTYSIAYRAEDRTLTDEEVNAVHGEVVDKVTSQLGVTVRA